MGIYKKKDFFSQNKKFFINNLEQTAEYVKTNCQKDLDQVINVAEDVCKQHFRYILRWDKPHTQEPVIFENEIDWLYKPGDDQEFVFAFNRMKYWICLGQAYAVTKDEKYAQCFAKQLTHWIKNVPRTKQNEKAWRTIDAGLRMEYWLKAMCYFRDSPAITDEVIDLFINSLIQHAEYIMSVWDWYQIMSNWGVMANHGLFIAAVMLPTTERTKEYLTESTNRLYKELLMQVYEDGVQWEQSPMYHNEVLHHYLDVMILAKRNNVQLPEGFEKRIHDMAKVNVIWQKPDGYLLSMGDSDQLDNRDISTKAACIFDDPILKAIAYDTMDFETAWDFGAEYSQQFQAMKPEYIPDLCTALTESGNFFCRSDNTKDAVFLHFKCGTLGAGHGHSDQTHIDLFANGEDILVDGGRYTYVTKPERFEFKEEAQHNTTIIDGKGVYTYKDSWECYTTDKAINRVFKDKPNYTFIEGGHLGYMTAEKGAVYANRKVIYIKPDIFIINDELYTGTPHQYTNFLHFNNLGHITEKERDHWTYNSTRNKTDIIFVSKDPLEHSVKDTHISRAYDYLEDNKTLTTIWNAEGFTSLFTVINTTTPEDTDSLSVKKIKLKSCFKNIIFDDDLIEALEITKGKRHYLVVIAHKEWATPTDTYTALGCTGFGQVTVFDLANGETEIGTIIQG